MRAFSSRTAKTCLRSCSFSISKMEPFTLFEYKVQTEISVCPPSFLQLHIIGIISINAFISKFSYITSRVCIDIQQLCIYTPSKLALCNVLCPQFNFICTQLYFIPPKKIPTYQFLLRVNPVQNMNFLVYIKMFPMSLPLLAPE